MNTKNSFLTLKYINQNIAISIISLINIFLFLFTLKKIRYIFLMLFSILLLNSCIISGERIVYSKEGISVRGKLPYLHGLFWLPIKASSNHYYDYISIRYNEMCDYNLRNINLLINGIKINLGSINYNQALKIQFKGINYIKDIEHSSPNIPVKMHHITYIFKSEEECKPYYPGILYFMFEQETLKIQEVIISIKAEELKKMIYLENIEKSIITPFPFYEEDLLYIFGEDGIISRYAGT